MSVQSPLLRQDSAGIAVLTLNRPQARNALSDAMIAALTASLDEIRTDKSIACVILAANGPVFCAGHDLKEMTARRTDPDRGRAAFADVMARCAALMLRLARFPKPVIAAVEGIATAAGAQLVASSDLAICGENARFCTPGVHIGLFCSTPMVALSRSIAPKHALEMLLTGEMISAGEAHRFGLVNRVVPAGQALDRALDLARQIAVKSPLTLKIGKEAFHRQAEMGLEAAYAYASEIMVENMLARDAEEGIGAVLEKREPVWRGE